MSEQQMILVDENDAPIGTLGKDEVHRKGLLHRAFSVFIFDTEGRMLLQQRAATKYHGALLWTNACCSHPFPGEDTLAAAQRRLREELGFSIPLQKIFCFTYRAQVENNLIEHEFDHVFVGEYEGPMQLNAAEVAGVSFKAVDEIKLALKIQPANFTTWFRLAFPAMETWWQQAYQQTR